MSADPRRLPAALLLFVLLPPAGLVSAMVPPSGRPSADDREALAATGRRTHPGGDAATQALPSPIPLRPPTPPEQIMLSDLEALYEPVPFDHKGHVDMAAMSDGCVACHHHTPTGQDHPACRTCHAAAPVRDEVGMPGLKGAYHRQCLSCHIEWSHDTACSACHIPKTQPGVCSDPTAQPGIEAAMGRMGPPRKPPDVYAYTTSYTPGPNVTFHHGDHAETFGIQCAECHRGDSCGTCHDNRPARPATVAHPATPGLKAACLSCHAESNCSLCHDQSERPRFDHAVRTGWSLEPHHADMACAECHGTAKEFTTPSTSCHACHARRGRPAADDGAVAAGDRESEQGCFTCHTELSERLEHAVTIHGPASGEAGCTTCHDLSAAVSPRPHRERQRELCLGCHSQTIDTGHGRVIGNLAALIADHPNLHGPVREGDCVACHNPHGSDHAYLLARDYTPAFYASFDFKQYALCFGCHDESKVMSESGGAVTGFRQGERNLHKLHVNREKGRTCRVCHEVHASSNPFHIRESVPFGDSSWSLPINFVQTTGGGSCAPGCHGPSTYDRGDLAMPVR